MASLVTSLLTETAPKVTKVTKVTSGKTVSSAATSRRSLSSAQSSTDDQTEAGTQPTFGDHMARQTVSLPHNSQSRTRQANSAQLQTSSVPSLSLEQNEDAQAVSDSTTPADNTSLPLSATNTTQENAAAKAKAITADATAAIATSLPSLSSVTENSSSGSTVSSAVTDDSHKLTNNRSTKNQHKEKLANSENTAGDSSNQTLPTSDSTLELAALSVYQPSFSSSETPVTLSGNDDQTTLSSVSAQEISVPSSFVSSSASGNAAIMTASVRNMLSDTDASLSEEASSGDAKVDSPDQLISVVDSKNSGIIKPLHTTSVSQASSQTAPNEITSNQTADSKSTDTQLTSIKTPDDTAAAIQTFSATTDTQTASALPTSSATTDTQAISALPTNSAATDTQTASALPTSSATSDTQTANALPTNGAATDAQTRDNKTVLTMPADIKVSSSSDTRGSSFFHDDVRPTSATSFSQIQSLQDITTTTANTEPDKQSLLNNTQSPPQTKTEAIPDPAADPTQNILIQPTVVSTNTSISQPGMVSATQESKIASTDVAQTAQVTGQPTDTSAQVQMAWNPAPVTSTLSAGKVTTSRTSLLDDRTSGRTDISSVTQAQSTPVEPQTDDVASSTTSEKTSADQQGNRDDNKNSDQHTSSDRSLTANMTLPQPYNEATPFSEQLVASTASDASASASTTTQASATTSSSSIDTTAASDASSTALNLTVALQNDDQTPLHVTIDKSDKSDGLNIHIGADGLTTLNELQTHKHELVHALENAGISTAGSQISFGLADNNSDSSFSQNHQSQQQSQDNSTNTAAGSSDFANAFGGTLSGNSNGDGSRNAWSATPSTTMISAAASDADETSDQIYASTALRTGSVNITA